MPYPVHPMDPNDPNYDPKLDPHSPQYTPNDPRLVGGVSPYVTAGGRSAKGKKTITDDDWGHLVTGQPHSSQVAGEDTAPSGSKKIADDDWGHLVTGESAPSRSKEPPEPPPEPDLSGGFGLIAKGYQKNPVATAAIGSTLALPLAATGVAGAGVAVGAAMSALPPFWQALLGGSTALYGAPWAARKIGEFAGAPQTGEAVGSLMDIIHGAGKAFVP